MPVWPPVTTDRVYGLDSTGRLTESPGEGSVAFDHNPDDPTPSVGGRHMSAGAGRQDNQKLEQRADVVVFTSDPLPTTSRSTVRRGFGCRWTPTASRSPSSSDCAMWTIEIVLGIFTESFTRVSGAGEIELGPCAHVLRAGHRLRLQVSGGAYPRYAPIPGRFGTPSGATVQP